METGGVLGRVLRAEILKLKRTFAMKMAVLAPVAVWLLLLLLCSQTPFTLLRSMKSSNDWLALAEVHLVFWGLLMLPLFITLETSLVAGVDHAENQWKALLARPVPRWVIYVVKQMVVVWFVLLSTGILVAGLLVTGLLLPHLQQEVRFAQPMPVATIVGDGLSMCGLAFLAVSLQHWVSLRWRSFAVATGIGIVSMVVSYGMFAGSQPNGAWTQYFPWTMPMLVVARWQVDIAATLWVSVGTGVLVTLLGCLEFERRDAQ